MKTKSSYLIHFGLHSPSVLYSATYQWERKKNIQFNDSNYFTMMSIKHISSHLILFTTEPVSMTGFLVSNQCHA